MEEILKEQIAELVMAIDELQEEGLNCAHLVKRLVVLEGKLAEIYSCN